ncbi:MAG: hypothetical protein ACOVQE_09490 [Chitinophagaceae bacterium]
MAADELLKNKQLGKYIHSIPILLAAIGWLIWVLITIIYGNYLTEQNQLVRLWNFSNLLYMLPIIPLLLLHRNLGLPVNTNRWFTIDFWLKTVGVGVFFGLLDVLVVKIIMHPQPYGALPPFLQPFPYSIFLYTSGALEIELYYRLLPLIIGLALLKWQPNWFNKKMLVLIVGILSSCIEPLLQFPENSSIAFMLYATISGLAMNAWQFWCLYKYGFSGNIAVRLGHYCIWHILLGVYVEFVEL